MSVNSSGVGNSANIGSRLLNDVVLIPTMRNSVNKITRWRNASPNFERKTISSMAYLSTTPFTVASAVSKVVLGLPIMICGFQSKRCQTLGLTMLCSGVFFEPILLCHTISNVVMTFFKNSLACSTVG